MSHNLENKPQGIPSEVSKKSSESGSADTADKPLPREIGGRKGSEPTRFGDWEKNGRCIDF
jgi:hypothetical protein